MTLDRFVSLQELGVGEGVGVGVGVGLGVGLGLTLVSNHIWPLPEPNSNPKTLARRVNPTPPFPLTPTPTLNNPYPPPSPSLQERRVKEQSAHLLSKNLEVEEAVRGLPCISPVSPLYRTCICSVSPLYLPYIEVEEAERDLVQLVLGLGLGSQGQS